MFGLITTFMKEYATKLLKSLYPLVLALAACSGRPTPEAAGYFKVAVIVDTTSDPVSREQAEAVIVFANGKLLDLTGFGLQLVDFVEADSGGPFESLVENYMHGHQSTLPNGILIFSVGDDDRAKIHRAYAQQIPAPEGFRNAFVSPYLGDGYMYIAVLQFNYRYAACGYAGTDTIQSPVSSGGECPGMDGEACAEWEGMQVCQAALPFLEGHTPIDMAAGPVIHEFMHAFGNKGPDDHYTSEACHQAMGWEPDYYDLEEAEYYNDFCPNVYGVFADSYRP
jgi:hypothetical protein